jgi:hypothetical protein
MSNQPILDPVEETFRDLRGAVYTADGRAAMTAIEGQPDLDVLQFGPLYESDFFDQIGEPDDEVGEAEDLEDDHPDGRWLRFDSLGSRPGFRDMAEFLETVADEHLADRLDRALGGRGPFRRFKDELADRARRRELRSLMRRGGDAARRRRFA